MRHFLFVVVLAGLVACGSEYEDPDAIVRDTTAVDTTAVFAADDLVTTLENDGRFSTFATAIDSAGLRGTLSGPGSLTIFAPTDDAFDALEEGSVEDLLAPGNRDALRDLVMNHVINGRRMGSDLRAAQTAESMYGADLRIDARQERLRVGQAEITEADIEASNGVIHAINTVLSPPDEI